MYNEDNRIFILSTLFLKLLKSVVIYYPQKEFKTINNKKNKDANRQNIVLECKLLRYFLL